MEQIYHNFVPQEMTTTMQIEDLRKMIQPISDLEKSIIKDPQFIEGANWGKPRNGHPEGQVAYHIIDVLNNIKNIRTLCAKHNVDTPDEDNVRVIEQLRLIAIIHDTFKNKVDTGKPKSGENHHAMIARRFAEKYINDPTVLDIIELHDEAYLAQRSAEKDKRKGEQRFIDLIKRLYRNNQIWIYTLFYMCDNATGDKDEKFFTSFYSKTVDVLLMLKQKELEGDFLESQEFYDLMQDYRNAPMSPQILASKAYEQVKDYIKKNIQ